MLLFNFQLETIKYKNYSILAWSVILAIELAHKRYLSKGVCFGKEKFYCSWLPENGFCRCFFPRNKKKLTKHIFKNTHTRNNKGPDANLWYHTEDCLEVALLAKSCSYISFIMFIIEYVVGFGLQDPELIFHLKSDISMLIY